MLSFASQHARSQKNSGGWTNAALHLPAIANEAGIDFDIHVVGEIFRFRSFVQWTAGVIVVDDR